MQDWGTGFSLDAMSATVGGMEVDIELVGPHLRVGGKIALGRFSRLSDRVNHGRGYLLLHDARLLKRNGEPTSLTAKELYVNPDEVTFVAMSRATDLRGLETASATRPSEYIEKQSRRYVVFTPGHVISGTVHVFPEMTLSSLVDSTDPRFIPMTHVSARSLADRRVVSHFELLLVNRTQMTAVAIPDGQSIEPPAIETEGALISGLDGIESSPEDISTH